MQTQASNASAEAQAAKTESAVLAARIQQLQQELHFIQQSAERRQEDFKTLKQLESSWSERTALQAQQMSVLQAECERLKTLIAQTVQEKSAEQQHLKELCEDLKRQLDEKIRECENLAHSADLTLKAEVLISREQAVKEQTTKQQHHDTVLRSQWHWLKKHQQRLIAYRNQLTEEEAELKHIASKLAQELKISGAVHPLQDYLKMTDLELSKIELELKKLPGSSMDRPHFEAVLTQLTEQRNFLRSTIETTQQTLQKRTQIVLKIAGEDLLNAHKTAAPEWNPPQGE
jgi:hypothetical protein